MENRQEEIIYSVLILFTLPFIFIGSLLTTYIVWDICVLYKLTYLTQVGYEVFFGTMLIFGLISGRFVQTKTQTAKKTFESLISVPIGYLLVWATAYFLHWILKF